MSSPGGRRRAPSKLRFHFVVDRRGTLPRTIEASPIGITGPSGEAKKFTTPDWLDGSYLPLRFIARCMRSPAGQVECREAPSTPDCPCRRGRGARFVKRRSFTIAGYERTTPVSA